MTNLATSRPRLRLPAISWRHELLVVAYIGLELSWLTPWFLIFVRPAWRLPPYVVALMLGGLMLAFYAWPRAATYFQADVAQERLVALLALPLVILLSWRLFLHPGIPLLDLRWIQEAGYALVSGGSGHWLVTATALILWWRGLSLSRREFTFEAVSFSFRLGLLLLVIALPLLSYLAERQVLAFVFPFFFFSLIAVSLTRLEEVGQLRGEVGRLFDAYWLAVLVAAILLLLGMGRLLLIVASPAGMEALRAGWAPVGELLIRAIIWLLGILLAPLEPILAWLAAMMARGWQSLLEQGYLQPVESLELGTEQAGEQMGGLIFDLALNVVRYLCAAGILLALLAAGWWALNEERKRQREQAETHEDLEVSLGDALAGLLRNARDRLRAAAGLLGQFGLGSDLLAAISVRNIYANMARLAARRGYPRDKARTPYEYLPDLLAAFPQAAAEAQAITDAYVAVHYGELPASRAELDALRAAYARLWASPPAEVM